MDRLKILFVWILLTVLIPIDSQAQNKESLTFFGAAQIWTRYATLNPGSTIDGIPQNNVWAFSLRRYRLGVKGSVNESLRYCIQLGNNNLNQFNKDIPPKLLDAYIDYDINSHISLAVGKHAYTGLTRYAAPSTFHALGTDINYAGTPFLNVQDDFFRKLGIALHGQTGKWDYRLILNKPFSGANSALGTQARFINDPRSVFTSGYLKYQFLDKEGLSSAFSPWTYHGSKQIFNIGGGFLYENKATATINNGDTLSHAAKSFAVDILYERTHHSGCTWTFSASFIHHNLGPNFIRSIGANNAANGATSSVVYNGKGNAFPTTGSGNILLSYAAFHKSLSTKSGKNIGVQPYIIAEYANFDALNDKMIWYEIGCSYLLNGHASKFTIGFQNRPIFINQGDEIKASSRAGMVVLQYEVKFKH